MSHKTLHLLILHESTDLAEQLINSLRNAGHATRAEHVSGEESLQASLAAKSWDMLIARPETEFLNASDAMIQIQKLEKDIPVVILLDDEDIESGNEFMQMGAQDAIQKSDALRLELVVARELRNLENRRELRLAERSVKETEKRSSQLLEHSKDAIAYVHDGMHIYANQAYVDLFGFEDADDLEITPIMDLIGKADKSDFKEFIKEKSGDEKRELQLSACKIDGEEFPATLLFAGAEYDGESCTQITIPASTEDPELKEQLEAYKSQDLITGLPNMSVFETELDSAVEKAINENATYPVFVIKLDYFNKTKSNIGLSESDILLGDIANQLKESFTEPNIIARFGEDAFAAIDYQSDLEASKAKAESIREKISESMFEVEDRTVQLTCSVGIAFINEVTTDGDKVLHKAFEACNLAYEDGSTGNTINAYDPVVVKSNKNINVSEQLQEALDSGHLKLLYQPVINLRGEENECYEVFLRVLDEDKNEISITDFLQGMSTSEIGEKIDRWVILQAIKALSEHRSKGHNTKLFMNITERSLLDKSLLPWLSVALKAARLPGNSIVFQISETDAISYLKQAVSFTNGISELKCQLAIKQFGCALHPFNILKHLKVDFLKIDHSFTKDLEQEENKTAIKELVDEAQKNEKLVIVPFVESAAMLSTIWQLGANYIQGYYFQEPSDKMDYDFSSE